MIEIFTASVSNVRELKKQRTSLKRLFNQSIKRNDRASFSTLTKLYALLYSSFAEVCFLKIAHTPYGFSDSEISQIHAERKVEDKWNKCLGMAFSKVQNMSNAGDIQNKRQILDRHIIKYIIEPSQLRNKIAHGQWKIALNNDNTAIKHTQQIKLTKPVFENPNFCQQPLNHQRAKLTEYA